MVQTMQLLLIEDDPAMQTTLRRAFERRGIKTTPCGDGGLAIEQWVATQPDVVVLDLTLPNLDGLLVLTQARAQGLKTPVLILTARGTVGDKILGLNTGADDYLPKPFDLDELEARVRALARRNEATQTPQTSVNGKTYKTFCGLRLDGNSHAVYLNEQVLDLAPRENALLRALLAKPGTAIAKERLFECVFPDQADVQFDAIEVVVYRLRKKLQGSQAQIVTLRGLGYLLKAASTA
jgi:two-component system, OmpR family, response regulator TctD